jgi:N4-gp56 family major capsid protein
MPQLMSSIASNLPLGVNFQMIKGLLSAARQKLPFFNGTLPGQLQKHGSTASVKWERLENLAAATTALGEVVGSPVAFFGRSTVQNTLTVISVAIAKYGNAVLLTEEVDLQQMNVRAARFVDNLGANAGLSLNILMADVFSAVSGAGVRYCISAAGSTASADTQVVGAVQLTDIKYAVNQLNRNSAMLFTTPAYGSQNIATSPVRASYYGISHVDVEEDIRGLTGFVSVEQYGGYTETLPFEFGAVGGVRWCSTEVIPISVGAGTTTAGIVTTGVFRGGGYTSNDIYSSFIYGKEAVGSVGFGNMHATNAYEMYDPRNPPAVELIVKPVGTVGTDLYNEVSSVAWKAWFAGKILNNGWIVKLRSLSARV